MSSLPSPSTTPDFVEVFCPHNRSFKIPNGNRLVCNCDALFGEIADLRRPDPHDYSRDVWRMLHEYKWVSAEDTRSWYYSFWLPRVPRGYCRCVQSWEALTSIPGNEPDFSSPWAFYKWGVDRHSDVNVSLGKPIWIAVDEGDGKFCAKIDNTSACKLLNAR